MTHKINKVSRKLVVIKTALVIAVSACQYMVTPAHAGIPTIDSASLAQSIVTAKENVAMSLRQIQQLQLQLQQYQNMLKNSAKPNREIWDKATVTMTQLRGAIDTLNFYKTSLGSIDTYLGKFQDTAGYRNSPCYSPNGCTPAQWEAMKNSEIIGSQSQKKATDGLFRGLDQQHNAMQADASRLEQLQSAAKEADGQMQAIGYANQLASHQANQLLQIRALLMAQQNVIATRNQALADREAKEAAASAQLRRSKFQPSLLQGY